MANVERQVNETLVREARARLAKLPRYDGLAIEPGAGNWPLNIERHHIIPDFLIVKHKVFQDNRGETEAPIILSPIETVLGHELQIRQTTRSRNLKKGTGRGLHCAPYYKITECTQGSVQVVVVDLRPNSPTFKKVATVDLISSHGTSESAILVVPPTCAHAYITLTAGAEYSYIQTGQWTPDIEVGVSLVDPEISPYLNKVFTSDLLSAKDLRTNFYISELFPWRDA